LIADALTGIFDEHCRAEHPGVLADVLGVKFEPGLPGPGIALREVVTAEGHPLARVAADAGLKLTGAEAQATSRDGVPVLGWHKYGKGGALLLNVLSRDYQIWRTLAAEMPFRDAVAKILSDKAGLGPTIRCDVAARGEAAPHRIQATEFHRYRLGKADYVGVLRSPKLRPDDAVYMADLRPKMVWMTFDRKAHVYDVRRRMYRGLTDKIEDVIYAARAELYALLPYEVRDLELTARWQDGAVSVAVQVVPGDAGSRPTTHVFHIDVTDPAGCVRSELARNVVAEHGRLDERIFLGYNARPGAWRFALRDVASGLQREVTVLRKPPDQDRVTAITSRTGGHATRDSVDSKTKIRIARRVHRRFSREHGGIYAPVVGYVSADKPILFAVEAAMHGGKDRCDFHRSMDNGRTWTHVGTWDYRKKEIDEKRYFQFDPPGQVLVDSDNGRALRLGFCRTCLKERDPTYRDVPHYYSSRPYISYSFDEGATWTDLEFITQKGEEYDQTHWMKGAWFGKNGCFCDAPHTLRISSGAILAMMFQVRLLPGGHHRNSVNISQFDGIALLGRWNADQTKLAWEAGDPVPLDYNWSMNGINENAVAELPDGRLLMISRSQWPGDESMPIVKLTSVSTDHGVTWSRVKPLRYDDGGWVHSPASMPTLIRSIKNGRLYFIGNILPLPLIYRKVYTPQEAEELDLWQNPPEGMSIPRTALHIGEIDAHTFRLKRETVTVIDRREPNEPRSLHLSNFCTYQDRETKDIVLFMTRDPGDARDRAKDNVSRDLFRYDICLPGG